MLVFETSTPLAPFSTAQLQSLIASSWLMSGAILKMIGFLVSGKMTLKSSFIKLSSCNALKFGVFGDDTFMTNVSQISLNSLTKIS